MLGSLFQTIVRHTYTRSDFLYRMSLLKEFLEFIFFVDQKYIVNQESLSKFIQQNKKTSKDLEFLTQLSQSSLALFTKDSFYDSLDKMSEESKQLETLSLVLAIELPAAALERIGTWARRVIAKDILLEISIDPSITAGCQIILKKALHDFSFAHYIQKNADKLHSNIILSRVSPAV